MDIPLTIKIKEELVDEEHTYLPPLTPSDPLEECYLNRQVKTECEVELCNNHQVNYLQESEGEFKNCTNIVNNNSYNKEDGFACLDERDGMFKYYKDVCNVQVTIKQEEDLKNYCDKCNIQYDNHLASQKHYLFAHYDISQLAYPCRLTNDVAETDPFAAINDCYDAPLQTKMPVQDKEKFAASPVQQPQRSVIPLKYPKNSFKVKVPIIAPYKPSLAVKLLSMEKKNVTNKCPTLCIKKFAGTVIKQENVECSKDYTLESIKENPLKGIRVVKKSDIQFNELLTKAETKTARRGNEQRKSTKVIIPQKRKYIDHPATQSYQRVLLKEGRFICSTCMKEFSDFISFDSHMLEHSTSCHVCKFCSKKFWTRIALTTHELKLCQEK